MLIDPPPPLQDPPPPPLQDPPLPPQNLFPPPPQNLSPYQESEQHSSPSHNFPPNQDGDNTVGGDAFVCDGFRAWNRLQTIRDHASKHMSAHHKAVVTAMELFKKQKGSIITALSKQTAESRSAYRKQLEASITAIRWLLLQGLPFRGHDENESLLNRGNFISLLTLLLEHDVEYSKVVFKMAPGNYQLTSSGIQKDIIHACAKETTIAILEDLNGGFFVILADESVDVSDKEQLALCLRYVSKKGEVCERFLGIVHVANTTSLTLKAAIESLLMEYS